MRQGPVIGLAAHVDAGKTTLSESMLFLSGAVRRQGRVDHGDAFLDTEPLEKERGITIFSKEARLTWNKTALTLVDTPGHTDFSGETERALSIMDLAVLVISAPDGVQAHTRTLWHLMQESRVPVVLFVNKTDRFDGSRDELLASLGSLLSDRIVSFSPFNPEKAALCDEEALDTYLREGDIPPHRLHALVRERKLFPCFFGSALRNEGVSELLDFLAAYDPRRPVRPAFGARVYKIARDPQGVRLTFLKIMGGVLKTRDALTLWRDRGDPALAEKASEIRMYSGARFTPAPQAAAGELCCVTGLSRALPGDGIGADPGENRALLQPCYSCRLVPERGADLHRVLDCLRVLEEEEPLLQTEYVEARREIRVHSMGDVYLEVLRRRMQDRFGIAVSFADSSVLYRETILDTVEGVGHYEPLRHYAEVHLLLSPLPRGSGLFFDSAVSTDDLALNWQRLILTHLQEKTHAGVLTGSPITDMKITLVAGRAHLKHTEGGDFRQATYRALRQGLMKARSVLLEPVLSLDLTIPSEHLGRVMNDLTLAGGQPDVPTDLGNGLSRLTASAPAAACAAFGRQLGTLTRGQGRMSSAFLAYEPCSDSERIIAARGYDPLRDVLNSPDSVFCSHGAGYIVPWNEVEQHMHLPLLETRESQQETASVSTPRALSSYGGTAEEDETLRRIFERTYGPVRSAQLMRPPAPEPEKASPETAAVPPAEREILLVDGYNVLYAWEEWQDMVRDSLEAARTQLMDLMCNYAGATGKDVILVFDAYRVHPNQGTAERYHNIFVIYTREAQTADAFIEQATYLARGSRRVRVITSDQPEQLIAAGNAAMRTSAREFRREVAGVQGSIAALLEENNRRRPDRSVEQAYKSAWKKKTETSS